MFLKFSLFIKELTLFAFSMFLGVFVAFRHTRFLSPSTIGQASFTWSDVLFLALFIVALYFVMSRFHRTRTVLLFVFFAITILVGSTVILSSLWNSNWVFAVSLVILLAALLVRVVVIHNIAVIFAIVGITTLVGIGLKPVSAVILLVLFSIYDIVAVYWTRHMVSLARGMIESGVVFGFVIPSQSKDFLAKPKQAQAQIGGRFMILGSGDAALPLILISSVAAVSVGQAIVVALFACAGLFLTHILFVNQHERRAMAALPPIAMATIIGYLITLI